MRNKFHKTNMTKSYILSFCQRESAQPSISLWNHLCHPFMIFFVCALALDLVIPMDKFFQHLTVLNFLPLLSCGPLRPAALFDYTSKEVYLVS